jgi:hypothetical protein
VSEWAGVDDDLLGARLVALGESLRYPPTPALAPAVRERLAVVRSRRAPWLRPLLAVALAALVLAALVLVIPPARTTVAHWLGIRGVEITPVQTLPPVSTATAAPSPSLAGSDLDLGVPVSLAEAQAQVHFHIGIPATLGALQAVWLRSDSGGVVTLVYTPRPGSTVLVTEFVAEASLFQKFVTPQTHIVPVTVDGAPGYWVDGINAVGYKLPDGSFTAENLRIAGPTLLFERGTVSVRVEGIPTEAEALAAGTSLR